MTRIVESTGDVTMTLRVLKTTRSCNMLPHRLMAMNTVRGNVAAGENGLVALVGRAAEGRIQAGRG